MKLILALLVLLMALAYAGKLEDLMKIIRTCAKENKVTMPEFRAALKKSDPVPENVGCVYGCYAIKKDIMKEDGSINTEAMATWIGIKKRFGAVIKNCSSTIEAGDKCANGKVILDCLKEKRLRGMEPFGLVSASSPSNGLLRSLGVKRRTRRPGILRALFSSIGAAIYYVVSSFLRLFSR